MKRAATIQVPQGAAINSLVFLEDGKHLLSGGEDGFIRWWSVENREEIEDHKIDAGSAVRGLALSGDGNWIVSTGEVVIVWDRRTRKVAHKLREHTDWVNTIDMSLDSTRFVTGSDDTRAIIWDISNGKHIQPGLPLHENRVDSVRFSPSADSIAVVVWNCELRIYNAQTCQLLRNIAFYVCGYNSIAWSSDSQHIFALKEQNIKCIHADTGTFLTEWTIQVPGYFEGANLFSIAVSTNGMFVTAIYGLYLTFWDTSTRVRLGCALLHPQALRSMALSLDNNYLAVGSKNGAITLRNLNDIIPVSYLPVRNVPQHQIEFRDDFKPQIRARPKIVQASELRSDGPTSTKSLLHVNRPQTRIPLQRIPDGTYRIKSNAGDLYLTCPQGETGAVVVQPLDQSDIFQMWSICLVADGAYDIMNNSGPSITVGHGALLLVGQKGTAWTFDPRGDAYVIGNAANAMALHLEPDSRSVSVLLRNDSAYQRWILEPVTNSVMKQVEEGDEWELT